VEKPSLGISGGFFDRDLGYFGGFAGPSAAAAMSGTGGLY
jgi:hypothetical protein